MPLPKPNELVVDYDETCNRADAYFESMKAKIEATITAEMHEWGRKYTGDSSRIVVIPAWKIYKAIDFNSVVPSNRTQIWEQQLQAFLFNLAQPDWIVYPDTGRGQAAYCFQPVEDD